jgi:prepilin-type N-terminal cleavage/methylation domain-containing protein
MSKRSVRLLQGGFTLLEVIIAVAILTLSLGAILSLQSNGIEATIQTKRLNQIAMLARSKMTEIEADLEGKAFSEAKTEQSGQFAAPFQQFGWKAEIKEIEFPNLSFNSGKKDEKESQGGQSEMLEMMTKAVTKFLSKSLREVSVSITWKEGNSTAKEQKFTVATYWVDLNHEFDLTAQ